MNHTYSNRFRKLWGLLVASMCLLISTAQAEYTSKLVVLSGTSAPGIPGALFSSSFGLNGISLSDGGKAVFSARLEMGVGGITADNNEGIWVFEGDTLRLLVQKGGSVPRFTGVILLKDGLPQVFMGPDGQIGMAASYSQDGTFNGVVHAFFAEENGVMVQKFTSTNLLPSGDTLFAASLVAFNAGRFLFTGAVRGPTVFGSSDIVIGEYGPQGFNILSQSEHSIPNIPGGWLFSRSESQKIVTSAGKTIFSVQAGRIADNNGIGVVYSWDPVNGHVPLRVSGLDSTFAVFGNYQLNTQGNNVHKSWKEIGLSYSLFNTDEIPIVSDGDLADGANGATFRAANAFINFGLYDNDSVVFQGATSDGKLGIWGGDASGIKKIAMVGDPAPGRPGNFVFWRVNNMDINRNGLVAFSDLAVDTVTDSGYVGVWIGRTGRGLQLAVQSGDIVEDPSAGTLIVDDAFIINDAIPSTGADGQPTGLNDNGDILLFANFQGGQFGLILATPGGMIVNSNGDAPDIDTTDGICDTGNELPNGEIECTLRAAIMEANAQGGLKNIDFDIKGNTTISPLSALPAITSAVTIDGNTQPDGRPIVLDGVNTGAGVNGLEITGSGRTIAGLEIGRFGGAGIKLTGDADETVDGVSIIDCYIGLRSDSQMDFGNLGDGINVAFGRRNFLGSRDFFVTTPGGSSADRSYSGWNYIAGNRRDGIRIASNSTDNSVHHNVIGLRKDGTKLPNHVSGVTILDSDRNIVGGVEDQERNIISGNTGAGVTISVTSTSLRAGNNSGAAGLAGSANIILNNFIGLTEEGAAAGNGGFGVEIFTDSCLVGGTNDSGNVISDNGAGGISIRGVVGGRISGNYIGVDTLGLSANGNRGVGIELNSTSDIIIGGSNTVNGELDEGNLISANDGIGIDVVSSPFVPAIGGVRVYGNFVGVGIDNATALPNLTGIRVLESSGTNIGISIGENSRLGNQVRENKQSGILLFSNECSVASNRIERNGFVAVPGMGPAAGDGLVIDGFGNTINNSFFPSTQIIARNNGVGIRVIDSPDNSTSFNTLNFNSIFANVKGGIDLDPVGPNSRDPLDADGGANDGQNSPRLFSVFVSESNEATIVGILNSKPNEEYSIVAYANDACDPLGLGQGQLWIGNASVTTDASGAARINFTTLPLTVAPANVTLTATDRFGSTSEFSNCSSVFDKRVDLVVSKSDDADSASVNNTIRYEITVANHGIDSATSVTLIDTLPPQISYVSHTSDHGPCVFLDGRLTCDLGTLPPGDSATVILVATVNSLGLIENRAVAFANEDDINPLDNVGVDSSFARDIQTGIGDEDVSALPREFSLSQNHPNPFNPTTVISYALPKRADVTITIYNILGRRVRTINQGTQSAGRYSVTWNADNEYGDAVSSGMYFYKLVAGDFTASKKMVLLK